MGGRITVRKIISPLDMLSDDDDDVGIPPEILAMMRMTEQMHMRAQGNPFSMIRKDTKPSVSDDHALKLVETRTEESHSDIMQKFDKLSEEIGERTDRKRREKYQNSKDERVMQVIMVGGVVLLIALVSFVITCKNSSLKKDEDEDD